MDNGGNDKNDKKEDKVDEDEKVIMSDKKDVDTDQDPSNKNKYNIESIEGRKEEEKEKNDVDNLLVFCFFKLFFCNWFCVFFNCRLCSLT